MELWYYTQDIHYIGYAHSILNENGNQSDIATGYPV